MATTVVLYPNPATRRLVEAGIASNKVIFWSLDNLRCLFSNPNIVTSCKAGAMVNPQDNGAAMNADFVVLGGPDGFAAAARSAGLYTGNGLSSETEDWNAANFFLSGAKFYRGTVYGG